METPRRVRRSLGKWLDQAEQGLEWSPWRIPRRLRRQCSNSPEPAKDMAAMPSANPSAFLTALPLASLMTGLLLPHDECQAGHPAPKHEASS